MSKLKVFVGSSSEAREHDVVIRKTLEEYGIEAISWSEIFHPGDFGLDSLIKISNEINGALIIATSDDATWYRGNEYFTPRDNILFEMGLFIKALGRNKTGFILLKNLSGSSPKIPTDLAGLNLITYDVSKPAKNELKILKWINNLKQQFQTKRYFDDSLHLLKENYHKIPDSWKDDIHDHILAPFRQMSIDALRGEFTLTSGQYYNSIISQLNKSNTDSVIRAINLLPVELWEKDEQQQKYAEQNFIAIKNGALIKRIFVCEDKQNSDIMQIINEQLEKGIKVKLLSPRAFAEFNSLEDCMIISHKNKITSYLTNQYLVFSPKLRGCRLNVNYNTSKELISIFERAWTIAKDPK